jgi:hypothetical protein
VDPEDDKDEELGFQNTTRALKAIYGHSDRNSSTDEGRKMLHIMYGCSWDMMSRCVIKTLCREVVVVVEPHHK